jgi:hypothetical protein
VDGKRHTFPLRLLWRRLLTKRLSVQPLGFGYAKVRTASPAPWVK